MTSSCGTAYWTKACRLSASRSPVASSFERCGRCSIRTADRSSIQGSPPQLGHRPHERPQRLKCAKENNSGSLTLAILAFRHDGVDSLRTVQVQQGGTPHVET